MASNKFFLVSTKLFLLLVLLETASCANLSNVEKDFKLCLDKFSHPSYPTSDLTYTSGNSSFSSVLNAYARNARFQNPETSKPLLIVTAKHVSNIQATIACSKALALQMRIRSGGHDMEGLSYRSTVPFVILDMFNLRSIQVDLESKTAWVEAGATLGEVYYNIAQKSPVHAFPGGVCPTVGTAGHFSGAGYGNLMRKFGLASDNIIDAVIVDAQGKVLNREAMGEDLFWAIRGGGGASFGVILAWRIKLVSVPSKVTVFRVTRSLEKGASKTLHRWQYVAPNLPKELFIRFQVKVLKGNQTQGFNNNLQLNFVGIFLGEAEQLVKLVADLFPQMGLTLKECNEMPWVESVLFFYDAPNGTPTDVLISRDYTRVFRKVKSDYVKKPIPMEGIDQMMTKLIHMDGLVMEWNPYGGRMNEISETELPYSHRAGRLFKVEYDFIWNEEGKEVEKKRIESSRRLHKFMAPYVSDSPRESFFNYIDLDLGINFDRDPAYASASYGSQYYGINFQRLVKVKTMVDPLNFFWHEQSIPPLPPA